MRSRALVDIPVQQRNKLFDLTSWFKLGLTSRAFRWKVCPPWTQWATKGMIRVTKTGSNEMHKHSSAGGDALRLLIRDDVKLSVTKYIISERTLPSPEDEEIRCWNCVDVFALHPFGLHNPKSREGSLPSNPKIRIMSIQTQLEWFYTLSTFRSEVLENECEVFQSLGLQGRWPGRAIWRQIAFKIQINIFIQRLNSGEYSTME